MQPSAPELGSWSAGPGLLTDYERLWIETSDAPRIYHVAAGLAVIAATVENRVYLPFGGERVYPNVWAIILGPSSFFRKSTCIAKARKTLVRANPDALLPDEFSREALLKKLTNRGQGLLTYSEFSGALATFGRDYMSGTKELLADLYDSPDSYSRAVGDKEFKASNVCLSILAASQTGWFLEKLRAGDVRGGFLARFTFWPAFEKRRFLPIPPDPDMGLLDDIVSRLQTFTEIASRACNLDRPGVRDRYSHWLDRHERELHGGPHLEDLSPFWSRLTVTALKFAMLLQIAHDAESSISLDTLDRALALTDFLKHSLRHLFTEEFVFTNDMRNRQKVLRHIRTKPGIAYRDLMRACNLLRRQLDPVLDTLYAEETIRKEQDGRLWRLYAVEDADLSEVSASVSATGTDDVSTRFSRVK